MMRHKAYGLGEVCSFVGQVPILPVCNFRFVFYVNGEKVTTTINANTGNWHHICVLWSSNRGSWKIYMDGIPMDSGRNLANGQTIRGIDSTYISLSNNGQIMVSAYI